MNVNINVDYEPLTYLETIPASCLHLPYPKNLDSDHEVYHTSPRLKGGATLHRFRNAAGVEYSAIYVGRVEQKSAQREREFIIIIDWYLYCLENGIRWSDTTSDCRHMDSSNHYPGCVHVAEPWLSSTAICIIPFIRYKQSIFHSLFNIPWRFLPPYWFSPKSIIPNIPRAILSTIIIRFTWIHILNIIFTERRKTSHIHQLNAINSSWIPRIAISPRIYTVHILYSKILGREQTNMLLQWTNKKVPQKSMMPQKLQIYIKITNNACNSKKIALQYI